DEIHRDEPLDFILVTGDATDAGRSVEWAEFLSALTRHPRLFERTLIVPGNHDVNVVDRANPARLDLPPSPGRRLRQMRALSAMAAVQGDRVRVVAARAKRLGGTLGDVLAGYRLEYRRLPIRVRFAHLRDWQISGIRSFPWCVCLRATT